VSLNELGILVSSRTVGSDTRPITVAATAAS
jgi:hypothetical protein